MLPLKLQGERASRAMFVIAVHGALLWSFYQFDRVLKRPADPGGPATVWLQAPVMRIGAPAAVPEATPFDGAQVVQRVPAPFAVPALATVTVDTPVAAPPRVVLAQAAPSSLPVPSAPAAPPVERVAAQASASDSSAVAAPLPAAAPAAGGANSPTESKQSILVEILHPGAARYKVPALSGEHWIEISRGTHQTIEAAMVHDIVLRIRARYPEAITWEALRGGGMVRLSMRVEDETKVEAFLLADMFGMKRGD